MNEWLGCLYLVVYYLLAITKLVASKNELLLYCGKGAKFNDEG